MEWIIKKFHELNIEELYSILLLRSEVFVVEQNCVYQDIDEIDRKCIHVFLKDNDKIITYGRIIPKGIKYKDEYSLGRIVTKKEYRHKGYSNSLLEKMLNYIEITDDSPVVISAQYYIRKFYENVGFKKESDIYLEDDIEHIRMRLVKASQRIKQG